MLTLTCDTIEVKPSNAEIDPTDHTPADLPSDDDRAWWATQNADWHEEEPEPDWDAMEANAMLCLAWELGHLPI